MSLENQSVFWLLKEDAHTSHETTLMAVRSVRGRPPEINWKLFIFFSQYFHYCYHFGQAL